MKQKLRKNYPYGKKNLEDIPIGAKVSLVAGQDIIPGTFHSIEDGNVILSYGRIAYRRIAISDIRSFALV